MLPGKFDITVLKGKTFSLGFAGKFDDGQTMTFDAYNEIRLEVRQPWVKTAVEESTPLLVLKKSTGDFTVAVDGQSFEILIDSEASAALTFNDGRYDLDLLDTTVSPAIVDPFLKGKFTVLGPEDA